MAPVAESRMMENQILGPDSFCKSRQRGVIGTGVLRRAVPAIPPAGRAAFATRAPGRSHGSAAAIRSCRPAALLTVRSTATASRCCSASNGSSRPGAAGRSCSISRRSAMPRTSRRRSPQSSRPRRKARSPRAKRSIFRAARKSALAPSRQANTERRRLTVRMPYPAKRRGHDFATPGDCNNPGLG
jgi:hypothetical protein